MNENNIITLNNHYGRMKESIPTNHRGYLFVLNNGILDEEEKYDIVLGHETITPASGFTDNPTKMDSERVIVFMHPDSETRIIPFYKFPELQSKNDINFTEMEEIFKRTNEKLSDFFILSRTFGFFYRRTIEEGIPCFKVIPARGIECLTPEEQKMIDLKIEYIKEKGINLDL